MKIWGCAYLTYLGRSLKVNNFWINFGPQGRFEEKSNLPWDPKLTQKSLTTEYVKCRPLIGTMVQISVLEFTLSTHAYNGFTDTVSLTGFAHGQL